MWFCVAQAQRQCVLFTNKCYKINYKQKKKKKKS